MYCRSLPFAAVMGGSLSNRSSSVSVSISFDFAACFDLAGGTLGALVQRPVQVAILALGDALNLCRLGVAAPDSLLLELPENVHLREGPALGGVHMVDGPVASNVTATCDAFALGTAGFGFTFAAVGSVGAGAGWAGMGTYFSESGPYQTGQPRG